MITLPTNAFRFFASKFNIFFETISVDDLNVDFNPTPSPVTLIRFKIPERLVDVTKILFYFPTFCSTVPLLLLPINSAGLTPKLNFHILKTVLNRFLSEIIQKEKRIPKVEIFNYGKKDKYELHNKDIALL